MTQGRREIQALLDAHEFRPTKRLGQNFLADPNLVDRIVRTAHVGPTDRVLEVGAGTGTLTRALAETGADVLSYETDRRLEPILEESLEGVSVDLRFQDVTKVDLAAALGRGPWIMVANLPYNIGTRLLLDILRHVPAVKRFVVMVQREVADRLLAPPGSRTYGVPSVVVALHAEAGVAFTVPPEVFFPVPEVDSAVVEIDRRVPSPHTERAIELAASAFQQRRKMLRRSLAEAGEDPGAALRAAGIDETARPEDLPAVDFVRLAGMLP